MKSMEGLVPASLLAKRVKNDIKKLDVGESILISGTIWRHSTLMSITCAANEKGKKTFSVVQYNEGVGSTYHYTKINENGMTCRQSALEIIEVDEEKLFGKDSHFIKDALNPFSFNNSEKFYEIVIPQLKGQFAPESDDPRLWSYGQLGGSCSSACVMAFIRSQLSEDVFSKFQLMAKTESLLKLYRQIKRGCENSSMRKLIALEIVKQLESHECFTNHADLAPDWSSIKKNLETNNPIKLTSSQVSKNNNTKTFIQQINNNLKAAFNILKDASFSHQAIEQAQPFLDKAGLLSPLAIPSKDFKIFIKIALQIRSFCKKRPLNSEQIYTTALISCIIKIILQERNTLQKISNEKEISLFIKQCEKLEQFANKILNRCVCLSLEKEFNTPCNFLIEDWKITQVASNLR